jgi:hypothetical protein
MVQTQLDGELELLTVGYPVDWCHAAAATYLPQWRFEMKIVVVTSSRIFSDIGIVA